MRARPDAPPGSGDLITKKLTTARSAPRRKKEFVVVDDKYRKLAA